MTSVKTCLALKSQPVTLVSVGPNDKVVDALRLMQDKRVRAILVLEGDQLLGIVTQGDCAIKVLLPGLDCKEVAVKDVMTAQPVTVKLDDPMEACTGLMAARNFRHLPVLEQGKVVGVVSVGDVIKQNIREMEQQIGFLETYIKGHGG